MSQRPVIGVVPLVDYKLESLWMLPGYFDAVAEAGGVPVMLPLTADAEALSRAVTIVTHDHPEGLKGAEATAVAVYMGKSGAPMADIRACMEGYYALDFTLDAIRETYRFNETCQQTVPQALEAFFESTGFEDAIRNAISIGGDSDTLAAITGGVAEAYYGVPEALSRAARGYLDERLLDILERFEAWER